jgi:pimeloyl-[acyl-carrier protein] methyl ester esterase
MNFSLSNFEKDLLEVIEEKQIEKISLFGWSLGGCLAANFSAKFPDLIDQLILVGLRKKYPKEKLLEIKACLKKNKKGYLYKFYNQCFSKKENRLWFKKNLFQAYCREFDLDYLMAGLDYLAKVQINPQKLKELKKIKLIHGQLDQIAPCQEALGIKNNLDQAEFILLKDAGHAAFLEEDLGKYIC